MLGFSTARKMRLALGSVICPLSVTVADEVPVYAERIGNLEE